MKGKHFSISTSLNTHTMFSLYYQRDPTRVNVCPVTVHALLHIAGSIKAMGPVWCYWAFPMERYCGTLSPAIRSRRNPWRSMDRFVLETAQLTQIKVVYDMHVGLALGRKARVHNSVRGSVHIPGCTLFLTFRLLHLMAFI